MPLKRSLFVQAPRTGASRLAPGMTLDTALDTELDGGFDEDVSVFDADRPPSVEELKARRKPPSPGDRRVSDAGLGWMASLPSDRRLMHTMLDYPHVVNELSQRWSDRVALTQYFESLLHSRRRRRAGFLAPTQGELMALADWAHTQGLVDDLPLPLVKPK